LRRALIVVAVAVAASLASPGRAEGRESYCSPSGDYCTSVARVHGAVLLRLGTFSFRGRVRVCVADPFASRVCRRFLLRRVSGRTLYEVKVRWHQHYPNRGPGNYRVTFRAAGTRLGPVLTFRLR
jgi:hypothetical protein